MNSPLYACFNISMFVWTLNDKQQYQELNCVLTTPGYDLNVYSKQETIIISDVIVTSLTKHVWYIALSQQ